MDFQALFTQSKGQPIIYNGKELKMIDRVTLKESSTKIKITFLTTDSIWKQGVVIKTKGYFDINDQKFSDKIVLWEYTAPKEVELIVKSKDKILVIYNVWETLDGTIHYWHNGGAMYVEERDQTRIYDCNDGVADDDFNDLVFQIIVLQN
ncbi:MAG TPA: hypothetical protein VHE59_01660 [Mucilaginibacter sp.]|nr:hypothetical protein [Mucilaginibacter sp.]